MRTTFLKSFDHAGQHAGHSGTALDFSPLLQIGSSGLESSGQSLYAKGLLCDAYNIFAIVMMFVYRWLHPFRLRHSEAREKTTPLRGQPSLGDFDDFVNQALKDWKCRRRRGSGEGRQGSSPKR